MRLTTTIFNFQFFQKELPQKIETDPDVLFNLAFAMKINTKKMKKMEKEYVDLEKKKHEEMVELRVSIIKHAYCIVLFLFQRLCSLK